MLFYQFISTTAVLEQLIHDLATSIEGKPAGNNQTSSEGGIMFVYDKSPESTALSREYITKLVGEDILNLQKSADISKWPSLQQTIPDVRLSEPTRRPVLLRRIKGPLIISRDHEGVIIPVRRHDTLNEEKFEIMSGDDHVHPKLVSHTLIIVSGDDDVSITMPTHVPYNLILHPKPPSTEQHLD
jgi:hypothetical protein